MKLGIRAKLLQLAVRKLALVRSDRQGVAAVEFALILPLMLTIYLGSSEISQALMADQRLVLVSRSLADLVAQQPANQNLTGSQINDFYSAAAAILAPFSTSNLKVTLTGVNFVTDAGASTGYDAKPQWSVSYHGSTLRPCKILTPVASGTLASASTMPTGIYGAGSVIVADASFTYTPSFGGGALAWETNSTSLNFQQTIYMRPRNVTSVT